jgi:TonB-linked SusC/RagA family outer membrane protein
MKINFYLKWSGRLAAGLLICTAGLPAPAQQLASRMENSPVHAGQGGETRISLLEALEELKQRYNISLLFERSNLEGKVVEKSRSAAGSTPDEALTQLLQGTQLRHEKVDEKVYIVLTLKEKTRRERRKADLRDGVGATASQQPEGVVYSGTAPVAAPPPGAGTAVEVTISGTVTNENNEPLPGVTVAVKGTQNGTITDTQGKYRLTVADENAVLVFSFIGYLSEEVVAGSRTTIDVSMAPDVKTLSEVVVVGYGTQQKRDVTGAITTVKGADLTKFQSPSVDAMLQGQGTGIQVNQATGVPGGPVRVMIRGTSSISSATEPLWVIDGIPVSNPPTGIGGAGRGTLPQNPLATINPNDIESIEVLKDASATSIYGSRGSNGVIIVTTKSGKQGQRSLNINYSAGVTDLTRTPEDMGFVNAQEWIDLQNLARENSGRNVPLINDINTLAPFVETGTTATLDQLANTNWFDQILRQGRFQEVNLSASRGFEKGNFFISGNYRGDKGVLRNNDFDRYTTRANLEFEPVNNLKAGIKLNLAYSLNQRSPNGGTPCCNDAVASSGFGVAASSALPIYPVYLPEGGYFAPASGYNLMATYDRANYRDEFETYRGLGGIYLDYRVPFLTGLSLRTEWSADIQYANRLYWAGAAIRPSGRNYSEVNNNLSRNFNYNIYGTYNRNLGRIHNLNVVLGTESQRFSGRGANLFGESIPGTNQDFGSPNIVSLRPSAGFGGERYLRGYFGRLNYKLLDRYLIGASFRRDGISSLSPQNRWTNFAALSAGWLLSEENFLKSNLSFVSLAKLRASFGQTGNQDSPNTLEVGSVNWPVYGSTTGARIVSELAVTDLRWEKTTAYDVGFDFGLFNDRITAGIGYYRQDISGLLFRVPVGPSVGLNFGSNSIWANVGDMRNQGLEFSLNTVNIDRGGFRWMTSFNFTTNNNRLISITPSLDENGQGLNLGLTRNISGKRLSTYFVAEYAGVDPQTGIPMIYETDREYFSKTGQTRKTGNIIPATTTNMQNHRIMQDDKTGLPTFFGGFTNALSFKGFDFSAMFSFQGGNYLYDNSEIGRVYGGGLLSRDLIGNTWMQPGDVTKYPRRMWNNTYNINNEGNPVFNNDGTPNHNTSYNPGALDRFLYKGDFLRLRSLQLGYNVPAAFSNRLKLQGLRVFVSGNNILTFTGFRGWDPEQLNFGGGNEARNLTQGEVGNVIPQLKVWSAGINVSL